MFWLLCENAYSNLTIIFIKSILFVNLSSNKFTVKITIMSASTGKVKFFKEDNGYGFITDDLTGIDIFVHTSAINEPITKDDRVQFDVADGKKGKNAINVQKI